MRQIQLGCIVFRKKEEHLEFLLLRRLPLKGGFWQPPCGGFEEEDVSKLGAAYRELLEEAHIATTDVIRVIDQVDTFEIKKHYLTGEPISPITEYVFGFEVSPSLVVSIEHNIYPEHDVFEWIIFERALELLKWENYKTSFMKLYKLLNG